jgi:hypothetical protein
MTDPKIELSEALKSVGESFRPDDLVTKQRIFLHRRRRRRMAYAGGTMAFAAAVLAAIVFVGSSAAPVTHTEPQPPAADLHPVITAVIPVGKGPSGIGVGPSGVWVANHDGGTVSQIDPSSNQVVTDLTYGGSPKTATNDLTPDDVAVGNDTVWVGDHDRGTVALIGIRPGGARVVPPEHTVGTSPAHIDMAVSQDGSRVVAVPENSADVYSLMSSTFDGPSQTTFSLPEPATDVAVGAGHTWYLAGRTGTLFRDGTEFANLGPSEKQDLAVGEGSVWVAIGDSGKLLQVDASTGDLVSTIPFRGSYAALAVGDGFVWAVSAGGDSDQGWLTQIDPAAGRAVGDPLPLSGKPADVALGDGAVWVTQSHADTVSRIELRSQVPAPGTSPTPDASGPPRGGSTSGIPPEEIVRRLAGETPLFVLSQGDLFAQMTDRLVRLTDTPAVESEPAMSPDGRFVVFQRADGGAQPSMVMLDLTQGSEGPFRDGRDPAFASPSVAAKQQTGPAGWLARFVTPPGAPQQVALSVGDPMSESETLTPLEAAGGGVRAARHITWSDDGLFLQATLGSSDRPSIYMAPGTGDGRSGPAAGPLIPAAPGDGTYVAPSSLGNGRVYALYLVDDAGPPSAPPNYIKVYLGWYSLADVLGDPSTARFQQIAGPLGLTLDPGKLFLAPAGHLWADETAHDVKTLRWTTSDQRTWFVGDGSTTLVVDEQGRIAKLATVVPGGLSAPETALP